MLNESSNHTSIVRVAGPGQTGCAAATHRHKAVSARSRQRGSGLARFGPGAISAAWDLHKNAAETITEACDR
jgi:hypothetical protein